MDDVYLIGDFRNAVVYVGDENHSDLVPSEQFEDPEFNIEFGDTRFHFINPEIVSGSVNLDYRLLGTNTLLDGLGSNLLFTFNSGHAFTYVYRPVGGQVSAFDAGVDYMNDTRSRQALEPIGASTTPWVYNLDLKLDKRFEVAERYGVTVFARVNNLLDRRNALNVYQATGSATDDGFYGNDVY